MQNLVLTAEQGALTKAHATETTNKIVEQVTEGWVNPLDALAKLSYLSAIIDGALKQIRPLTIDETYKYPTKTFADYGVEFQVKETTKWVYDEHDDEYATFLLQEKELKMLKKQCEERMQMGGRATKQSNVVVAVTLKK